MFDESIDYVGPIKAKMDDGDYDAARALLADVPPDVRESVRWTIAAMTSIVL
jgi:hypothetical protein